MTRKKKTVETHPELENRGAKKKKENLTYNYRVGLKNPAKAAYLIELGRLIVSKYSVADIVTRTKWDGGQAHRLIVGNLPLKVDDLIHIEQQLGVRLASNEVDIGGEYESFASTPDGVDEKEGEYEEDTSSGN